MEISNLHAIKHRPYAGGCYHVRGFPAAMTCAQCMTDMRDYPF